MGWRTWKLIWFFEWVEKHEKLIRFLIIMNCHITSYRNGLKNVKADMILWMGWKMWKTDKILNNLINFDCHITSYLNGLKNVKAYMILWMGWKTWKTDKILNNSELSYHILSEWVEERESWYDSLNELKNMKNW